MPKQAQASRLKPLMTATMRQETRNTIFGNCENFTVNGGIFNVHANPADESNFRRVKLGDLHLLQEVAKQNIAQCQDVRRKRTGAVVRRVPEVVGVRRIHQARVIGMPEDFTAVVYDGCDFEKHRAHAEQREEFRHPSLVQLFGVTSSARFKALIYNDALMPLDEFTKLNQQSPLVVAFWEYQVGKHFGAALTYWKDVTQKWLLFLDSDGWDRLETGTVLWMRILTGELCIEVNSNEEQYSTEIPLVLLPGDAISRVHLKSDTNLEDKLFSSISLDDIHRIFSASGSGRPMKISDAGIIILGSLSWPMSTCAHLFSPFSEISLLDGLGLLDVFVGGWECADSYTLGSSLPRESLVILPNGWTRATLADLRVNEEWKFSKRIYLAVDAERKVRKTWLSQANYIMDKSGLDADDCYLMMDLILQLTISPNLDEFTLQGTFMTDSPVDDIYLFLFPTNVDSSGGHLAVHLPLENEAYYWSFDPAGIDRLPQDVLDKLALPSVNFHAIAYGSQWSKEVYDSIGKFHCAKGFNPASHDVAIELGYLVVDVDRLNNLINSSKIAVLDEAAGQEGGS